MGVAAVVFDLDDTLIASDRARMRKLRHLLGPDADLRRVRAVAQKCWEAHERGECSWEEQRRRRWTAVGVPEERASEVDDEYRAHYETIRIRPGARGLVRSLKSRGVLLALVSNGQPSYVEARLREHRLRGPLRARLKPQLEVFDEAVERLGVPAAATVVAGNDLQLDILPALDAGYAHGYWMDDSGSRSGAPERHQGPDLPATGEPAVSVTHSAGL